MNYKTIESLDPVVNLLNEASIGLADKNRIITDSPLSEVLSGALGAGIGGIASFTALYFAGTVGLSAAGITSALATAGALVGGGMVAGIFVLAAPIAILAGLGVGITSYYKKKKLIETKNRLYQEALKKHDAIINAMKTELSQTKERSDYLNSLNITLQRIITELKTDLAV